MVCSPVLLDEMSDSETAMAFGAKNYGRRAEKSDIPL
jgi:hypothetical protein